MYTGWQFVLHRISETIARHHMFEPGQRFGVAVSGGADSVCLLHALVELFPDLHLEVLHLDHGLRGDESRADAMFVGQLANSLNLPFHLETADLRDAPGNLEEAAREARLSFFCRFIKQKRLDRIALGHTRSDQAETVLFRFLRGAGTAGLAGVRPVTAGGLVRPLLDLERWEIEGWLRQRGISWREDSSNASREFARNRIRHDLLPQLAREWNPALIDTLSQMAAWAQDEERYWEDEIARLASLHLQLRDGAVLLRTKPLLELPAAVARRLLRCALNSAKGDLRAISFAHVASILELANATEGSGRFQIPGVDVMRSFDWLRLAPPATGEPRDYSMPLPARAALLVPGGAWIVTEIVEKTKESQTAGCGYNEEMALLDWRRLSGPLEVRNWRPGDQFQPVGHSGETKIKSLFQESRVPLWERRHWPVVTHERQIVWAGRFGAAVSYAAGQDCPVLLGIRFVPPAGESWNRNRDGLRL